MNYTKIYNKIIHSAKSRQKFKNSERHHIVPRCLDGPNLADNLVYLSYREHFLCHWLLIKIYPSNYKLKSAFAKMLESTQNKQRIVSSKQFDIVKRNLAGVKFPWLAGNIPWNKGTKGLQTAWNKGLKVGPMSDEEKLKRSKTLKKRYQEMPHPRKGISPWCAGTKGQGVVKAWNKGVPAEKFHCVYCGKVIGGAANFNRWHNNNCKKKF
jgi:hypothetical protein